MRLTWAQLHGLSLVMPEFIIDRRCLSRNAHNFMPIYRIVFSVDNRLAMVIIRSLPMADDVIRFICKNLSYDRLCFKCHQVFFLAAPHAARSEEMTKHAIIATLRWTLHFAYGNSS